MEDSKNKLLKLMWLPKTKEIVFDMQTEQAIPADNGIYREINLVLNLDTWRKEFKRLYTAWLEEDKNEL